MCPVVSAGKEKKNIFFKSRCKNLLFNFESILTLEKPGFSDFGTAMRRSWNLPSSVTVIQRPITMKFAIIIPRQKFYPATLKLLNYFLLRSGRKCWRILNSLSFL